MTGQQMDSADHRMVRWISRQLRHQNIDQIPYGATPAADPEVAAFRSLGKRTRDLFIQGETAAMAAFEEARDAAAAGAVLDDFGPDPALGDWSPRPTPTQEGDIE